MQSISVLRLKTFFGTFNYRYFHGMKISGRSVACRSFTWTSHYSFGIPVQKLRIPLVAFSFFSAATGGEPKNATVSDELLKKIQILVEAGHAALHRGQFELANEKYEEALNLCRGVAGYEPENASIFQSMANTFVKMKRYDEGIKYYQLALPLIKEIFGENSIEVGNCLHEIGSALFDQGNFQEALSYFEQALSIKQELPDQIHTTVDTTNNIGTTLLSLGRTDEALASFLTAFALKWKMFGENHPSVALTMYNLAVTYLIQKNYADAETFCKGSLHIRRKYFPANHPLVTQSLSLLQKIEQSKKS